MSPIVISSNTSWSVFNFRSGLIRRLRASGFRVAVLAPQDEFSRRLESEGCEFRDIAIDNKGTNPFRDLRTCLAYYRLYGQMQPALAVHYTIKPVIYGAIAARRRRIPFISTVTGLGTAFLRENWLTTLVKVLYRATQRDARKVFFLNGDDFEQFVAGGLVPPNGADVLSGEGVDLRKFAPVPIRGLAGAASADSGLSVPLAAPGWPATFLFLGRILWDKGVGEYVEAARRVRRKYPGARFQLLGPVGVPNPSAISRSRIDQWVREGLVEYFGVADDVRSYISEADCVVLPSYREGVPRSLLEAAAMARPIITTDVVGCRQVVEDGATGFLCRVRDADSLAQQMERIIRMPGPERAQMGLRGRHKMEREFDEEFVIDRYVDLIKEILPGMLARPESAMR